MAAVVVVASFDVENLFARPKAFNFVDWAVGEPVLAADGEFNTLIANAIYNDVARELLVQLDVYYVNGLGAARRRLTAIPTWARRRKNPGFTSLWCGRRGRGIGTGPHVERVVTDAVRAVVS